VIHEAFSEYYSAPRPSHKGSGRISVSSFGRCVRSVMLGVVGTPAPDFAPHIREVMDLGVSYENSTRAVLNARYGVAIRSDIPIGNDIWSGRMDFLLQLDKQKPTIIEHKATGDKYFDFNLELPKWEHVCQAWMYGQLYQEQYRVRPRVVLYYRAWNSYAELELCEGELSGFAEGNVNGSPARRPVALETLPKRRAEFEAAYKNLPNIPEVPCNSPCDAFGCTFRGQKSCAFYEQCWGDK